MKTLKSLLFATLIFATVFVAKATTPNKLKATHQFIINLSSIINSNINYCFSIL